MASISPTSSVNTSAVPRSTSAEFNGTRTIDILGNIHLDNEKEKNMIIKQTDHDEENPITLCEVLRQQNDALRQELHDIRREMDEITDQFRTEDAEEFKQLQAELEIAAKNCRILQFKLRKSEKRNENIESDRAALEDKIHQLTRENYRVRDLDEELLIAKEVSVRLHSELEKSEQSRMSTDKFNSILKENLDALKESLDKNLSNDYSSWQLAVHLYESLFREYFLLEELTCRDKKPLNADGNSSTSHEKSENNLSDLMNSYQQKISILNEEILQLKEDVIHRDNELTQLRIQNKILKQRSQSVDRTLAGNYSNTDDDPNNRSRRGVSVDGGGHLREQLDASFDEIRLLKNKLLRLEDELNNSVLEKETLLVKLDEQSKKDLDLTINEDLHLFTEKIENLINLIKRTKSDEKIINDLQQTIRSSRWNKQISNDETTETYQKANEFLTLIEKKNEVLNKIRYRLTNLTYDASDTCLLLEELDTTKHQLEDKDEEIHQFELTIENLTNLLKTEQERTFALERSVEQQKNLQEENVRLITLSQKQSQDLRHMDQLRQSIITFEKKLDQKQTRVNELSMKIIEKEDIIETKVKECQKHRLELRELETKYYTLGKQLEEQIYSMSKEMEKLNMEKEMLKFDLESLRLGQQHERPKSTLIDDEISRVKSECQQQIIDGEIEGYKLRLNQMANEKDELLKMVKDLEKKYRELQIKSDADEQSWTRMKKDMTDKQRKYDESIKMKSELQNAVDRLRQKLYDLEVHNQEKQNKYTIDKQEWENHRTELSGKINELEEQLSKITKRQRKDLESSWRKERVDLQKQLQQSQQIIKDLQKQLSNRDTPVHVQEKFNVLITENELLLNKIKELESIVDDVHLLKTEMQRLREKNSSDWNYWRKQQSDLYAQLRQQNQMKESILNKFDRLQKQIKSGSGDVGNRLVRDISIGPISLNSFQNEVTTKTSLSSFSRETLGDEIELPHGTLDGRTVNTNDIAGTMDDSLNLSQDKQRMFEKTYSAQENTAASIEEIATKIDRVEDHLFSYRRFMDFIRAKSEKSASIVRDDSFTNIVSKSESFNTNKRLASAPPEHNLSSSSSTTTTTQRRSRFDTNLNGSHEQLSSAINENPISDLMSNSMIGPTTSTPDQDVGSSKNRFFSLSRRFRFRVQSPEKGTAPPASVHFNDEDIDLETKERTMRKTDKDGNRPSKGILKTLRHRSPFRFRSKDAVIPEQEPSPPPPPTPTPVAEPPKETRPKPPPIPPSASQGKQRGRLVELKKTAPKPSATTPTTTTTARKTAPGEPTGSTLVRKTSGLKDLIHKFEITPSDRPGKSKRTTNETNSSTTESNPDESVQQVSNSSESPPDPPSKTIDIPDLLRNVEKDPTSTSSSSRPTLRHSNSNRQTTSFDSSISMVSASESITTNSSFRRPTSTARPLMIALSKDES